LPCSGGCGERRALELCLCLEVALCLPQSVASTRWAIQDELKLRNTKANNAIVGITFAAQCLACLCYCAALITQEDAIGQIARVLDLAVGENLFRFLVDRPPRKAKNSPHQPAS
jgi:hypothetical protein